MSNYLAGLLWVSTSDEESIIEAYYWKWFAEGRRALDFSKEVSRYVSMDFWNAKYELPYPQLADDFPRIQEISLQYQRKNIIDSLFLDLIRYAELFSNAMLALASEGRYEGPEWDSLIGFIREYEMRNSGLLGLMRRAFKISL